jgi:hypothetical protein
VAVPVTLQWYASSGATSYVDFYMDTAVGQWYGDSVSNTWDTLSNLVGGDEYEWEVYACNSGGCTVSAAWYFTTAVAPPAAPTPMAPIGANNTGTTPTLSWSQPSGAVAGTTQYNAYVWSYDTNAAMGYTGWTTQLSEQVPASLNLTYGLSYWWAVYACNGQACSGYSKSEIFSTGPVPGAPSPLSPANDTVNAGTTPTLSWSVAPSGAISNITTYGACLWDGETSSFVGCAPSPYTLGQSTQVPASVGLVQGRSYLWSPFACNDAVCSSFSTYFLFLTVPPPSDAQETAPANGATNTGDAPQLQWSAPTSNDYADTHYYVNLWDDTAGSYVFTYQSTGTALSDSLSGLVTGHDYLWNVIPCNGVQNGADCYQDDTYFAFNTQQTAPAFPGYAQAWYMYATYGGAQVTAQDDYNLGCSTAQAADAQVGAGSRNLILDFGAQTENIDPNDPGRTVWGNELSHALIGDGANFRALLPSNLSQTTPSVVEIAEAFVSGYANCNSVTSAPTAFIIGTNNTAGTMSTAGAAIWASAVDMILNDVSNTYPFSYGYNYAVSAGIDVEQDASYSTYATTRLWLDQYSSSSGSEPLLNFGACENCAYASTSGCSYDPPAGITSCQLDGSSTAPGFQDWTVDEVDRVAGGGGTDGIRMIPEIYGSTNADQWGFLLLYADANSNPAVLKIQSLYGLLTEYTASQGADNSPSTAWQEMYNTLSDARWGYYLTGTGPSYSLDIGNQQ